MAKQVKILKPYFDKEMDGLEIPEGVIMTYEDKKADYLIKQGFAVDVWPDRPAPKKPKKRK